MVPPECIQCPCGCGNDQTNCKGRDKGKEVSKNEVCQNEGCANFNRLSYMGRNCTKPFYYSAGCNLFTTSPTQSITIDRLEYMEQQGRTIKHLEARLSLYNEIKISGNPEAGHITKQQAIISALRDKIEDLRGSVLTRKQY